MSSPIISRNTGNPAVMMVQAIKNPQGQVRALLAIEMGLDLINSAVSGITIGESSYAWLIDTTGMIFSSARPEMIMQVNLTTADEDLGYDGLSALAKIVLTQETTSGSFIKPDGAASMVFTTEVSPDYQWKLGIVSDTAVLFRPLTTLSTILVMVMAAALVLALAISFVLGRWISRPIVKIALTLKDISEGEGDLTRTVDISSNDETGDLAKYFNQTLAKIKNLIIAIKQQTGSLSDIGSELSTNMTETAAAVNQITANIQSIKGRVLNQSASVTETNATMEQVTTNIEKLNGHVEKQSESVSKSSAAIEEMIANIQSVALTLEKNTSSMKELAAASEVGRGGLQEVVTDIQEIARESEGLLEINAVMENIASQTNLLSMNAAIEAAHAGEAGKGFAVVSGEIRKLAENSSEQSKTISAVLKKIKTSIDKITKSTGDVLQKFEAIESGVGTVSELAANVQSSMEEQNAGSRQILEVIGALNDITQQVKGGSDEMLEGSRQVIV
jgi:methyl-accepting chemotaxis protein